MSLTSTVACCTVVLTICLLSAFGDCRHVADEDIGSGRQQQPPAADAAATELGVAGPSHRQTPIRRAALPQSAMAFVDPSAFAVRQNADQRRSRLYIGKRVKQTAATVEAPDAYDVDGLSDVIVGNSAAASDVADGLTREQWVDRLLTRDGQRAQESSATGAVKRRLAGERCADE